MPFSVKFLMVDGFGRSCNKEYSLRGADYAAATANVTALLADVEAVTGARVVSTVLSEKIVRTDVATADANRDAGITLSVLNNLGEKSTLKMVAPEMGYVNGDGTVDITNAEVVAFYQNFESTGTAFVDRDLSATELLSGVLDK